jgi:ABC-type thiamine transport system ATPase subunit
VIAARTRAQAWRASMVVIAMAVGVAVELQRQQWFLGRGQKQRVDLCKVVTVRTRVQWERC